MNISAPHFKLEMNPKTRLVEGNGGPYFDWITCDIDIVVPGIKANIEWIVMPSEIVRFSNGLEEIYRSLQPGSGAILHGAERNFELRVDLMDRGGLRCEYRLQASAADGATLTGYFEIDQSYIPEMITDLNQILDFRISEKPP